jgi:serine phosphatase RsbU (regulator of sigma subunit)
MSTTADRALAALRSLLRASHLSGPDDLPALVSGAGARLGADAAVLYLVDHDQVQLIPMGSPDPAAPAGPAVVPLPVDGTLAGRAYGDVAQHATAGGPGAVLWTPVLDGTERLGVLRLSFPAGAPVDDEVRADCLDVAGLIAQLVLSRAQYGDAIERVRRRSSFTVPAEVQRRLLPPLTFVSPSVTVAGVVAPTNEVAGDSFDYAVNGTTAHVAIIDAMGHGLEAALLATLAISTLRNARRRRMDLLASVRAADSAIAAEFRPGTFVTGVVGELDLQTGWWQWSTCGHPPALLVRGGRVVKRLDSIVGTPLGLGPLGRPARTGHERLQAGDRLLLYTDGVVEARDADGQFFGTERLVDFVTREAAGGRPAAETLRRLNLAVLGHQRGRLQDDATTVMVEWRSDEPGRSLP